MLHEMSLHPISVAVVFVIFALMTAVVMFNMFKQRKMGLATFMLISTGILVWSAVISAQVPAS
ncbi:MAG TPA: hypothetical protein VFV52_07945 [Bacilli bacterium]|nr:hypothetical protein [Bacilli bacterium]